MPKESFWVFFLLERTRFKRFWALIHQKLLDIGQKVSCFFWKLLWGVVKTTFLRFRRNLSRNNFFFEICCLHPSGMLNGNFRHFEDIDLKTLSFWQKRFRQGGQNCNLFVHWNIREIFIFGKRMFFFAKFFGNSAKIFRTSDTEKSSWTFKSALYLSKGKLLGKIIS